MATRSNIGIEYEDGTIKFVYCHWDGYPDNNGKILFEHYKTKEKVEELISLGAISSLDKTPELTKDYNSWHGEKIVIKTTNNRDEAHRQEYCYIFSVKDSNWYIKGVDAPWYVKFKDGWLKLEEIL